MVFVWIITVLAAMVFRNIVAVRVTILAIVEAFFSPAVVSTRLSAVVVAANADDPIGCGFIGAAIVGAAVAGAVLAASFWWIAFCVVTEPALQSCVGGAKG